MDEDLERQLAEVTAAGDGAAAFEIAYDLVHERDDLASAERFYRVAIDAGETNAYNNLARILAEQGRDADAEALFREGVAAGDHVAVQNLALHLDARGRGDEALALLGEHAEADPECAETLARLHFDREQWSHAERWFRRAAEADAPGAVTCVGVLLEMRGEPGKAERWLRHGLELGDPHAAYHLGLLVRRRDDLDEAERLLRRAADETGDDEYAGQHGVALWLAGRLDEAAMRLEAAAQAGNAAAARNLAWLLQERGDDGAARPWIERAAAGGDAAGMTDVALARWRAGDLGEAERLLREAAPRMAHAAFNLGLFLEDRERDEAVRWLRDAAERGSEGAAERLREHGL